MCGPTVVFWSQSSRRQCQVILFISNDLWSVDYASSINSYLHLICSVITLHIVVMLQPLDITNVDKSKHKFMVQSMYPPPGEVKLEEIVSCTQ